MDASTDHTIPTGPANDTCRLPFTNGEQIAVVNLATWLDWVTRNKDGVFVALPIIQRGSVWKPQQIDELWDSLLRGMPVGALTVSRFHAPSPQFIRTIGEGKASQSSMPEGSLSLLDGQQRTLAMCVGWPGNHHAQMDRRIWVDFGQPGVGGRSFRLRVTTRFQPFGFDPNDNSRRLHLWQRKAGRKAFEEANAAYIGRRDYELPLSETRPYGSTDHCLELGCLIQGWRRTNQELEPWIRATIERFRLREPSPEIAGRVRDFGEALHRLFEMQIALVCIPKELMLPDDKESIDDHEPDLVVLFRRIANAGTPLSSADYVFSLIKHKFPEAHNLVQELYEKENVACLLSATDLVLTAVRLAINTRTELTDIPTPSPREFGRILRARVDNGAGDFLRCALLPLIEKDKPSSLHAVFEEMHRLLAYRQKGDPGVPMLAFPLLERSLVQVLALWIHMRQSSGQATKVQMDGSRAEILRFVLFWLVCVDDGEKAGKAAIKILRSGVHEEFPGRQLYDEFCKADVALAVRLQHPEAIRNSVISPRQSGSKIRSWNARFYKTVDGIVIESQPFYRRWFHNKKMLLWLQRNMLDEIFVDANLHAGREEEAPYDYDHICPSADWGADYRSGPSVLKGFCEDGAYTIGNCIGNMRVWDSSSNRSDGNSPPVEKLKLGEPSSEKDRFLQHSAIGESEEEGWAVCSVDRARQGQWDENRALTFQETVENRALRLFERYFSEAEFDRWVPR